MSPLKETKKIINIYDMSGTDNKPLHIVVWRLTYSYYTCLYRDKI